MFESLTARFEAAFDRIRGRGRLSERQVDETLSEVRLALLEADVNQEVADRLLDRIRVRAVGAEVIRSVTPGHQVVKIVHESLLETLGSEAVPLVTRGGKPLTTLVVGLQGSGKTTTAAKLADHYRRSGKSVLMVAADRVRPGAVEQLQQLGERIGVPVFEGGRNPVSLVRSALRQADRQGVDVVVVDTAGRLQIDQALMAELGAMARAASPDEVLLVLDAMTGQESVAVARGFSEHIGLTGVVLSKLDSDARGGAAISVREATGFPVKLVGTGEGPRDLEVFHPERMASRILGMGDVLTLMERAEEAVDQQQAADMAQRLLRAEFTLEDYIEQVKSLRRMGSVGELLGMIPGARPALADAQAVDREVRRSEAIICSMTPAERVNPKVIDGSRRRRIAVGSGTSVQDVAGLVRQFNQMRGMFQSLSRGKTRMGFPGMRGGFPGSVAGALPGGLTGTAIEPPRGGGGRRPPGRPKKKPRTPKKLQKKKKKR
ncbi:MAG: signal recognition particle protein [bacterium]|nr:signal recognition particle protein [bacterium]MDE0353598.1 signal recognition particle protein [bacterium]